MLSSETGNIIKADVEALVNTVNCMGYMGKGIALQFKKAFPKNFDAYAKACKQGQIQLGKMHVFETGRFYNPKFIINFPTKGHWRSNSKIDDIQKGLEDLSKVVNKFQIKSIAIPPLGCGLGGLKWKEVKPLIMKEMSKIPDLQVQLFEPKGAPLPTDMPIATNRPEMTTARALVIKLMQTYSELDYKLTLLEIQKLTYFLQEAGQPLKLKFEKAKYGPYANNLNKVLEILEGHFISGYGDSARKDAEISLLPQAIEEADKILQTEKESQSRLEKISELIEGFETPYGMELLASTHWVVKHELMPTKEFGTAKIAIQNWTSRKKTLFTEDHLSTAWNRLKSYGWI